MRTTIRRRARERIGESLEALDASFKEDLPLVFDFLGVGDPERPAPKIDPEARQRQLLSIVRRFVQARSRVQTGGDADRGSALAG